MSKRFGLRQNLAGATMVVVAALVLLMATGASANVTGAVNTSDDPGWTGLDQNGLAPLGSPTQPCLNGPAHIGPAINCNIYAAKTDAFLSGSPNPAALAEGTYFFAVLAPGGQPDPNDTGGKNLSVAFDAASNREFSSNGSGGITPLGATTHSYDANNNVLQLAPFADTPNPGGVYILATCKISDLQADYRTTVPAVDAHDCKYDAFKVRQTPPAGLLSDLDVTKTATPSFTRDYEWSVAKQQTTSNSPIDTLNSTVNVHYKVQATWSGPIDGGWDVSGTITVTNPNGTDFTGVAVSDQITYNDGTNDVADPDVTCTVSDGGSGGTVDPGNATIPANGSVDFPYDCSYSDPGPASSVETNTASITWDGTTLNTPDSSASFDVPFVWDNGDVGNPTVTNDCTTVSDLWSKTNTTTTIGSACIDGTFTKDMGNNLSSFLSGYENTSQTFTFTYTRSVAVVRGMCTEYDNTATVTDGGTGSTDDDSTTDDDSSSALVIVCGPANTGALTIGFWKNTNGQGLIKTYCQSGALGTYLRGLGAGSGPFSTAPSTCSNLATYVSGILSGASATNMNVMLKAQMLGTALDVWFSGPGWTSTKIGSVKPPSNFLQHDSLGTFNMNTTAICPMVDNTTAGSASCQSNTPSTDAVASGALPSSPMSMQAILNFAATTTNTTFGGPFNGSTSNSVWYGGNRTLQTVLKNLFDQFNNGDAFGSF